MKSSLAFLSLLAASARAGTVIWNGFFNSSFVVADFDKWSFSNEIQPWQWYIHGPGATSEYLAVDPSYKNPADTTDAQGIKITIDGTSFWNGQTMERSEIIPQTSANLGTGHLYYHFSLKTSTVNPPDPADEHQIAFFESHCTEIKYGLISGEQGQTTDNTLSWDVGGVRQWTTQLQPNTWYNFAYDINFGGSGLGLWTSTGSDPLVNVKSGVSGSCSTNSADWHIGQLRLPNGDTSKAAEDWYWSGIYVEQGPITTSIAGPNPGTGGSSSSSSSSSSSTKTSSSTTTTSSTTKSTTTTTSTSSSAGPTQTHYGQCGGIGYSCVFVRLSFHHVTHLIFQWTYHLRIGNHLQGLQPLLLSGTSPASHPHSSRSF
ncbi:hypothetical protein SISNIDRAFT_413319 [Sistotremastrum niveocremeum HHB9708]|uniref:Glycoside hydrolase 131 catalytic N-terminal domain-containing protein n=1 Tax=Sistotremastrum niveocremeum HHB9708 TaxID=1314777 RepID=A0A164T9P4_9AGAM|nr:hypothetical protein SISNIDRAFT_413319 [Sistotremastrum niveocremeum HHB9708]